VRGLDRGLSPYADWFVDRLRSAGVRVTVTSVLRTYATQARLYRRYLAGQSRFPAAAPGTSKHEKGLAFDLQLVPPVYSDAGALWESMGGRWGGRFRDPIHFEV